MGKPGTGRSGAMKERKPGGREGGEREAAGAAFLARGGLRRRGGQEGGECAAAAGISLSRGVVGGGASVALTCLMSETEAPKTIFCSLSGVTD